MKIHKKIVKEWMALFQIKGTVIDMLEFLHKDEILDGERYIRIITGVETEEIVVIFKLVHEPIFDRALIESQVEFSQKLRKSGINTTYQYKTEHGYVSQVMLEDIEFSLTCEAFIGSKPETLTIELQYQVGKLLGKMHRISEEQKLNIGFARVYHEVMNKSSYRKIWGNQYPEWVDKEWIDRITEKHDSLMEEIQSKWDKLPRAAVQGDIFGLNNIAVTEQGLAVFDYNLASDEVLVGDFLLCWYRTITEQSIHCFLDEGNVESMWEAYATGYLESRPLSKLESEIGYKLCAVLGVLYLSKLAIELKEDGKESDAKQCLYAAERIMEKPRWIRN